MPYVGVRTILGRQGIGLPARVQDRFVNELGVETAFDLAELTQADLTSVGVGSSYARLRAELSRKFGANLEGNPQERPRRAAQRDPPDPRRHRRAVQLLGAARLRRRRGRLRRRHRRAERRRHVMLKVKLYRTSDTLLSKSHEARNGPSTRSRAQDR